MRPRLKHRPDDAEWAEMARSSVKESIEELLSSAADELRGGKDFDSVLDQFADDVRERTEDCLFHHVDDTGIMYRKTTYRYSYSLGGYRRWHYPLSHSDVPDELLDVETLVPDYREMAKAALEKINSII